MVAMVILHLGLWEALSCEPPAKAWREASCPGREEAEGRKRTHSHWGGGEEKKGWGSGWDPGSGAAGAEGPAPPDAGAMAFPARG